MARVEESIFQNLDKQSHLVPFLFSVDLTRTESMPVQSACDVQNFQVCITVTLKPGSASLRYSQR
jgi:hypothetical protein